MDWIPYHNSDFKTRDRTNAHALLLSYPMQGHITPFMKLAHWLANSGIKVTLLTTEFIHARIITNFIDPSIVSALPELSAEQHRVRIVSVPDGLEGEEDRKDYSKLAESISRVMPGHLENLIAKTNQLEGGDQNITCIIADAVFGWALEIAGKMGLKRTMFFTSSPGCLAMALHIPKLIEAGIIDTDGTPTKTQKIQLSPNLPALSTAEFMWNCPGHPSVQRIMFEYVFSIHQNLKFSEWILCNCFHELHPSVDDLLPNILSIGPLLANGQPTGNFWSEDLTCLSWLDEQPPQSVIYVAYGSSGRVSLHQFDELALGLELLDRPFLWVVRSDLIDKSSSSHPDRYAKSLTNLGKVVQWAPQEKVLAHPAVACYLTHCGWNSIMEGLSMGVPFLCWPFGADQIYNKSCICDGWKVGLELNPDENGIITHHEIKMKVNELFSNDNIRENAQNLKKLAQMSISQGGYSSNNMEEFVKQMKI